MSTKKEQILSMLRSWPFTSSHALAGIHNRFGASILVLRKEGHRIIGSPWRKGAWRYTYHGKSKKPYETAKLTCPECGFRGVPHRDARKNGRTG